MEEEGEEERERNPRRRGPKAAKVPAENQYPRSKHSGAVVMAAAVAAEKEQERCGGGARAAATAVACWTRHPRSRGWRRRRVR